MYIIGIIFLYFQDEVKTFVCAKQSGMCALNPVLFFQFFIGVIGQAHGDRGADADGGVDMQRAAVEFDQLLGDRQAEAGAFVLARVMGRGLFEGAGDVFEEIGGDADAGVMDLDRQIILPFDAFDADRAAGFGEFHRVRH